MQISLSFSVLIGLSLKTRAKDVLPNIHSTQAAESSRLRALPSSRHPRQPRNGPSPAARYLQRTAHALQCIISWDDAAVCPCDLDLWFPRYLSHKQNEKNKTRAKDVLPNIDRTQAAEIAPWQRRNGPVCWCLTLFAASMCHSIAAAGDGSAQRVFVPGDIDQDLGIQIQPSEEPKTYSL